MSAKKLKLGAFILMILTSVFGVTNIGIGFYRMGYAAIPMFVIGGLFFFIPFILMMIEFGTGFRKEAGGIFTWMRHSVSTRFAFIGLTMWFASYVIWMFGKALSMWVPLSFMLFGRDITVIPVTLGTGIDFGPFILGSLPSRWLPPSPSSSPLVAPVSPRWRPSAVSPWWRSTCCCWSVASSPSR